MADRRRGKQKRQQEIAEKPTKEEKAVAKYLRFNVTSKEGKLVGLPVQYFIASDAVNGLLESKWAAAKGKSSEALFTNRASCADYCQKLLMKGMFHRATRVERKRDKDRDKKKKKSKEEGEDGSKKEEDVRPKKEKKSRKEKEDTGVKKEESDGDKEDKEKEKEKEEKKEEEKKKKKERKIKLEMADKQVFKDGEEIYVWIYDPVPLKTFIIGLFLVLGAIAVCLFPLWPPEVRLGIYYLSLSVAGLIGVLLSLCVVRVILFALVWICTFGKHHFWLLPNLNEDVGFFDSFKPLYFHESFTNSDKKDTKAIEDKEKANKENDNTAKESDESPQNEDGEKAIDMEEKKEAEESGTGSELDNDNGYEIVDPEELTNEGSTDENPNDPENDEESTEAKKTK